MMIRLDTISHKGLQKHPFWGEKLQYFGLYFMNLVKLLSIVTIPLRYSVFYSGVLLQSLVRGPYKVTLVTIKWNLWWDCLNILSFNILLLFINMFHKICFAAGSMSTLVTIKDLQMLNSLFRWHVFIAVNCHFNSFLKHFIFRKFGRSFWQNRFVSTGKGFSPPALLSAYLGGGLPFAGGWHRRTGRSRGWSRGMEQGSGYGQDDQAWQIAGGEGFHLHKPTQAWLSLHFSSAWQAARNLTLPPPDSTFWF